MSEPHRPKQGEYVHAHETYVLEVGPEPLLEQLERNGRKTAELLDGLDPALLGFAYAPGKWTLGQLLGHMADAERVFTSRLLHAARGGTGALPGMDQELWATNRDVSQASLAALSAELAAVRASTLHLLRSLGPADWGRTVNANGADVTARALAYIIAGHELHHLGVIRAHYLGAD